MTDDAPSRDAERGRRLQQLFEASLDLEESDRGPFLEAQCGEDATLRGEVEALLGCLRKVRTSEVLPPLFLGGASAANPEQVIAATVALAGASNASGPAAQLERGQAIGRFVVLGLVGRGGMGEVYAAYDPELDRKVAVKLLRARVSRSRDGRARLLREAQAIAKLSHPNVVVVYDVGTIDERVFIAMEFVEGSTVGFWLTKNRPAHEILDVFLAAGHGLAAAHEAGMVHRDFKPDNVMITNDGQVRVMDFGLARQVLGDDEEQLTTSAVEQQMEQSRKAASANQSLIDTQVRGLDRDATVPLTSGGYLRAKITETGAQMGTPAYMAPEQFAPGGKTDERTDQFSFCVALYEALYGERPFAGDTVAAVKTNVLLGEIRPVPPHSKVPGWIRRILLRGLSIDSQDRFPSMAALLAALLNDPAKRTKKVALVGGTLVLMVSLVGFAHRLGSSQPAVCDSGGTHFVGIWEPGSVSSPRKAAIQRAFAQSGKSYAEQAYASVARLLDEYTGRWTAMYTDACKATSVRGEQSAEVLDLRMDCLRERLGNVNALSDVFVRADAKVVENAVSAAAALPSLDRCADVTLLRAVVRPPEDSKTRQRVAYLRGELAKLVALRDSGQCALAIPKANPLIADARAVGYQPLLADTLLAAALIGDICGDAAEMLQHLKDAHAAASASRYDQVAAEASALLPAMAINRSNQVVVAREWLEVARGDLARLGHETLADSMVAQSEGLLAAAEQQYARALSAADRALMITRKLLGPDDPRTIAAEMNKGDWQMAAGRLDEALQTDAQARAHFERVLGRDHPRVGIVCNNEGEVLNLLGRHTEAQAAYQRSADILRQSGVDNTMLAWPLTGLGRALLGQKKPVAAVAPLEEALAVRLEKHVSPAQLGETRFALARALWSGNGDRRRAVTLAASARRDRGGDTNSIAEIDAWLAHVNHLDRRRYGSSIDHIRDPPSIVFPSPSIEIR
jgi:eukaryotic-like serine/threonine-protein kinase